MRECIALDTLDWLLIGLKEDSEPQKLPNVDLDNIVDLCNGYQALAMRTSNYDHDRLMNGCLGLIGESGEVVDVVKKWCFQSGQFDTPNFPRERLIEECGDVLWYCAETKTGMKASMGDGLLIEPPLLDPYNFFKNTDIQVAAGLLASTAIKPFIFMTSKQEGHIAKMDRFICDIIRFVGAFLDYYCQSSLHEAMKKNIEKLVIRYPNGFDPERSLHRD